MKKRITSLVLSILLAATSIVMPNKCSSVLPCIDERRNGLFQSLDAKVKDHSLLFGSLLLVDIASRTIDGLSRLSKSITHIGNAKYYIKDFWTSVNNFMIGIVKKCERDLTVNEKIAMLKWLCEDVKGQEIAKTRVQSIIYGIIHDQNQAQLSGEKYSHGDVLYFIGPSGVGKSYLAEHCIAPVMSKTSPYIVSASEVDKSSGKDTIIDQLFGLSNYGGGYGYGRYDGAMTMERKSSLVEYLTSNPNGAVIVNEYDKMHCNELDEIFRTIVDQGIVTIKGQKIDCSGTIFIITSNESASSVFGKNQDEVKKEDIDDGTGSRTYIPHDKSFLNRVKIVEFSNLTAEEYEKIAYRDFKEKVVDYWKNPEVAGINIELGDTIKHVALKVESQNTGARCITDIRYKLTQAIVEKTSGESMGKYVGETIYVSYDEVTDQFTLYDYNPSL